LIQIFLSNFGYVVHLMGSGYFPTPIIPTTFVMCFYAKNCLQQVRPEVCLKIFNFWPQPQPSGFICVVS